MPITSTNSTAIDALRERIRGIEGGSGLKRLVLPFGISEIDRRLPGGGLALGALHEVAGGGNGAIDSAAAALFAAGIPAGTKGQVLWCVSRPDLFAPALAQAGLKSGRVIYLEAGDEQTALACLEEALRHGGLGAAIAEISKLTMTASRRLQLAAETAGTIGIIVRRWRRQTEAADFGQPTAAVTRWRVSALPSAPLPVPGIGCARWHLELCAAGPATMLISTWRLATGRHHCVGEALYPWDTDETVAPEVNSAWRIDPAGGPLLALSGRKLDTAPFPRSANSRNNRKPVTFARQHDVVAIDPHPISLRGCPALASRPPLA